jgi:Ion channel
VPRIRQTPVLDERRKQLLAWQERVRDPSLTLLLVLQLCAVFLAGPLAARGLPLAHAVTDTLVLGGLVIVVAMSHRRGAIFLILLGVAATAVGFFFGPAWSPVAAGVVRRGGDILAFSALTWVVAHAVYAPGRITSRRLQGAVVVYLNLALIFAAAFGLIRELSPDAFANLSVGAGEPAEVATMMYFSLTTLTTTGYGDIVPVDPFARSLANLEAVLGQFYLAITVARLVTLELEGRRL